MGCNDKRKFSTAEASTKAALRTKGAIDRYLNVLDYNLFNNLNNRWTEDAKNRFNIQGRLFNTNQEGNKVIPNREAFKTIDLAKNIIYKEEPLEKKSPNVLLQTDDMNVTVASNETIARTKKAAKSMGVSLVSLAEYAESNPEVDTSDVNGVADLTQGIIAVAQGKEEYALTEELIHIGTAIVEQINPQLITKLISKISDFKIYKLTLDPYKNKKGYQLSNGKPDIRKIKKEAVDKLIAETVNKVDKDYDVFPELTELTVIGKVKEMWSWILSALKGIYSKSSLDIYSEVGQTILNEDIGTVQDVSIQGVYAQANADNLTKMQKATNAVNDFVKKIMDTHMLLTEVPEVGIKGQPGYKKRHYTYEDPIKGTKEVNESVTEKIKNDKLKRGRNPFPERTGANAMRDGFMMKFGTDGHDFIQMFIENNLIDKDGYIKEFEDGPITTDLSEEVQETLKDFAKELVTSFPSGTRFLLEKMVMRKNGSKMIASKADFMAFIPDENTGNVKVDVRDWKFMNKKEEDYRPENERDLPWYKRSDWKAQMGEYVKMLRDTYGMKVSQLEKARMIPFITTYVDTNPFKLVDGLTVTALEIGKIDSLQETNIYLLPVPITNEPTGIESLDKLLFELNAFYERNFAYKEELTPSEKLKKESKLNQLQVAIRKLHVARDFAPLVEVGKRFIDSAEDTFEKFRNTNFETEDPIKIRELLKEMTSLNRDAHRFKDIQEVYIDTYEENDEMLKNPIIRDLGEVSGKARIISKKIVEFIKEYATYQHGEMILNPSKPLVGIGTMMLEGSKLSNERVNTVADLTLNKSAEVEVRFGREMEKYKKVLVPLQEQADAKGVSAFSMIGKIGKAGNLKEDAEDTLQIFDKVDPKFNKELQKSLEEKEKEFIKDFINMEAHDAHMKDLMDRQEQELRDKRKVPQKEPGQTQQQYSDALGQHENMVDAQVNRMKNSLDIHRKNFDGWHNWYFKNSLYKNIKEDSPKFQSEEYKTMAKNKVALDVWNYYADWGQKARDLGHIKAWENSFFPLIDATVLEKLFKGNESLSDKFSHLKVDAIHTRIDVAKGQNNIDPETGEVRRTIPVYYTKTNNTAEQLSKDLNKTAAMWIHSVLQYQGREELEMELEVLMQIEEVLGSYIVDDKGKIQENATGPMTQTENNPNVPFLKTQIRDAVFGEIENSDLAGNVEITQLVKAVTKSSDPSDQRIYELRVKKMIQSSNQLIRNLGVGLSYSIAVANAVGQTVLSFIYKGNMYKGREWTLNGFKVMANNLTLEQRALMDLIAPFSESNVLLKRRKMSDYKRYLNTFSFSDAVQSTNSFPEIKMQYVNALSFFQNTIVIDGKLINARQYVRAKDREVKFNTMSQSERRAYNKSYEERVEDLKNSYPSLESLTKITEEGVKIEGVKDSELAKLRVKILDHSRKLNGQMDENDKAAYRRSVILNSFMMFKSWIPKLVTGRGLDIKYNKQAENWEYGRSRLMAKTLHKLMSHNLSNIQDILYQTDKGIAIMDELLEEKKRKYKEQTGNELTITNEEWYDLMNTELSRQMREFGMLLGMLGLFIAAKTAEPPEDISPQDRNLYNAFIRQINKITDEVLFFYNPTSFQSITNGNLLPAVGLVSKALDIVWAVGEYGAGGITGDKEMMEDANVAKYILNIVPVGYQIQRQIIPLLDAELAKEMGNSISKEVRRK
jgi:hypothetical protein